MKTYKGFIIVFTFFILIFAALMSPYFDAETVEIIGLTRVKEAEVRKILALNDSVNIFLFNSFGAKKKLKENNYIETVKIGKNFIEKNIRIQIKERVLSGYVEYLGGMYLYIDEKGYVLEAAPYYTEKLPVVIGLNFKDFTVGKVLDVEDTQAFEIVVMLAQLFNRYELENDVIKVDVSNRLDIHFYVNKIDVEFGEIKNTFDADEKIRMLLAIMDSTIMDSLPDRSAVLDIRDVSKPARFRLLT